MEKILIILSIVCVIFIIYKITIYCISEYAFKKVFLCYKKNKDDSVLTLKNRNMLDEKIYNEVRI